MLIVYERLLFYTFQGSKKEIGRGDTPEGRRENPKVSVGVSNEKKVLCLKIHLIQK